MNYRVLTAVIFLFTIFNASAQKKNWTIEAESPQTSVTWNGSTADIISPKGTTLWYNQKLIGDVIIEYDAQVIFDEKSDKEWNRLSDLNCFWMASDPKAKDIFVNLKQRGGKFINSYALQLYYMGFGGNHNTTTRFRRYDADSRAINQEEFRPAIIKEFTDTSHLLRPNHWYHIRLEAINGHVRYLIDGECLVDWMDPVPLNAGWFGFRTTLSHTQLRNFSCQELFKQDNPVSLSWIGPDSLVSQPTPSSFGVPFAIGEVMPQQKFTFYDSHGNIVLHDEWNMAFWQDGSVKWKGFAAVAPQDGLTVRKTLADEIQQNSDKRQKQSSSQGLQVDESAGQIKVITENYSLFLSKKGNALIDSVVADGIRVGNAARLLCSYDVVSSNGSVTTTSRTQAVGQIEKVEVERKGDASCVLKISGKHVSDNESMLPFTLRLYCYHQSPDIKLVHSFVVDSLSAERLISSLGISFDVPMREQLYNRHVRLDNWNESVQPLAARRPVFVGNRMAEDLQMNQQRVPEMEALDPFSRPMIPNLAAWDRFRLSQLSPNAFSIRKAATENSPWVGTVEGRRANGSMFVGDLSGGLCLAMRDFWQSCPSSLEVRNARSSLAKAVLWFWSPEAEPMNLAHYDTIPHTLEAAYEDVQPGMSSPYGIARTSVAFIRPVLKVPTTTDFNDFANAIQAPRQLACSPEYLHTKRAFGIWSLPAESPKYAGVEQRLSFIMDFYKDAIDRHGWYGFWNYGDVMHQFDINRNEWMYDVGGYAWDNTELASNMMFWYNFLRSGRADVWTMAEAMSRHTSEVDVYHLGPNAMLGSRHNVSHWGCGAKEARISQAAWNRFYYYLTTDERTGDLMTEVRDADQMLYHLDPMRLAQPRNLYPCTAPARLRIGPDWLAYAANWMTEWERGQNTAYRDKIIAGMKSISALRHGIFSGPKALGFDPATGIITNECDSTVQNTNHLLPIMGGFEIVNELNPMVNLPEWNQTWLSFCRDYKQKALEISKNHFRIPRLQAYAGWLLNSQPLKDAAWRDILRFKSPTDPVTATNDAATWTLDAIFSLEVAP